MIRQSVGGRYIGLQAHIMEARMDHRDQAVTNKTEKPKRHKISFRPRNGLINIGMDSTGMSGGTLQTQKCVHVIIQHTNSGMD